MFCIRKYIFQTGNGIAFQDWQNEMQGFPRQMRSEICKVIPTYAPKVSQSVDPEYRLQKDSKGKLKILYFDKTRKSWRGTTQEKHKRPQRRQGAQTMSRWWAVKRRLKGAEVIARWRHLGWLITESGWKWKAYRGNKLWWSWQRVNERWHMETRMMHEYQSKSNKVQAKLREKQK